MNWEEACSHESGGERAATDQKEQGCSAEGPEAPRQAERYFSPGPARVYIVWFPQPILV